MSLTNYYFDWISDGNEWILSYLSPAIENFPFSTVHRFSIAHSIELYFKACITLKYNAEKAIKYNHDIFGMYQELREELVFLPVIEKELFDAFSVDPREIFDLSKDMQVRIFKVQYLLLLFKYVNDLKYPRFKKAELGVIQVGGPYPDYRYAELFYQIRTHLKWDESKHSDFLRDALTEDIFRNDNLFYEKTKFLKICLDGKP